MSKNNFETFARKHLKELQELSGLSDKEAQRKLRHAKGHFVSFLGDTAYNLLKGRIPLAPKAKSHFASRRKELEKAGWSYKYPAPARKRYLKQRGGSLSRDLSKLVLSALQCPTHDHRPKPEAGEKAA